MREIDINHVMSQLGIQPNQWQELQDKQNQQNEVERTYAIDPRIETSQLLNDPHAIKFNLNIHMKL
ncbi:hypothetical protein QFZ77_005382 [Paenibacillus sp. V4I3]|uniref:hypothetical protein n=1 Tax=unclassified Paenibacillus TaxID=185978 RepID=UPI002786B42C|nr:MULTISPECIES: hypothetical protein [unclassified Paenibacillus]MDQ0876723.1 hypothetical protein [Paenibacillus sp. V4I3]MDQ0887337.1 hypothetical protein [Paenibacillus sp. V4I9]